MRALCFVALSSIVLLYPVFLQKSSIFRNIAEYRHIYYFLQAEIVQII